jgi:hypothetical protein
MNSYALINDEQSNRLKSNDVIQPHKISVVINTYFVFNRIFWNFSKLIKNIYQWILINKNDLKKSFQKENQNINLKADYKRIKIAAF